MAEIVLLLWFLIAITVPIGLIVAAIIGFRENSDSNFATFGTGIAIFLHLVAISMSITPMFYITWGTAHRQTSETFTPSIIEVIGLFVELFYLLLAISYCTAIAGRERPWPLKISKPK